MSGWNEEPVVFECEGDRLVGILHRTAVPGARLGVLVVVGGPQYRVGSHRQFVLMARAFAAGGYPVVRFDYRGMGDSEGSERDFEHVSEDVAAARRALLKAEPSLERVVLWGLCDGASALLLGASDDSMVAGVVLANPWVRSEAGEATAYLDHYYGRRLTQSSFWRKVFSGNFDWRTSLKGFVATWRSAREDNGGRTGFVARMTRALDRFRRPVLLLLSDRDLTAREFCAFVSHDAAWSRLVKGPGFSVVDLREADHTFSSRGSLETVIDQCLRWMRANLD